MVQHFAMCQTHGKDTTSFDPDASLISGAECLALMTKEKCPSSPKYVPLSFRHYHHPEQFTADRSSAAPAMAALLASAAGAAAPGASGSLALPGPVAVSAHGTDTCEQAQHIPIPYSAKLLQGRSVLSTSTAVFAHMMVRALRCSSGCIHTVQICDLAQEPLLRNTSFTCAALEDCAWCSGTDTLLHRPICACLRSGRWLESQRAQRKQACLEALPFSPPVPVQVII